MIPAIIATIIGVPFGYIVGAICTNWKWQERMRNNFRG
jgi:hypothetical protein